MKFAWMKKHRDRYPLKLMCRLLGVSRSGYYARSGRKPGVTAVRRAELTEHVRRAHAESRGVYGSPRVHRELRARGVRCCENTVARIMRQNQLRSRTHRRFRVKTTDSGHAHPVAENVLGRRFDTAHENAPNRAWVSDLTYIPTREGWLYLAVVLDLYSRRVVGWATADHLKASLALDALGMAIDTRLGGSTKGVRLIHHSDRGVQYASGPYRAVLEAQGVIASMSRRGNCYDNAVAESFFASLKTEWTHHETYATRQQAQRSIFEYLEVFYNRQRRHSTLGYVSPSQYETAA